MSKTAQWLALSVDWMDSEMFDESTDGERLAWVCLLCYVKSVGRSGKAKVRAKVLAHRYNLSDRSVAEMLKTARKNGAITIDDNTVTLCNWGTYNDKSRNSKLGRLCTSAENTQSSLPLTTNHTPLTTNHTQTPPYPPNEKSDNQTKSKKTKQVSYPPEIDNEEFHAAWAEWIVYRKQAKIKKYTPIGAQKQLNRLAEEFGSERAIAAIANSITQGYQGIYEDKKNERNNRDSKNQNETTSRRDKLRQDQCDRDYPEPDLPLPIETF